MKRMGVYRPLLLLFILFLLSSYTGKKDFSFVRYRLAFSADQTGGGNQQNEQKKTSDQTENPPPKPKKTNLWKALLKFLKLKGNADKKLDGKVLATIEKLGIKDSIAATSANVRLLITELKKKKYQDLDSLKTVLTVLVQKQEDDHKNAVAVAENGTVNPSNVDMAALANQLIPLLNQQVAAETNHKDKYEKLGRLNRVKYAKPGTVYHLKLADGKPRDYTLKLKNKAEVFGFFDASFPADANAFFNTATSLIYYALPVNEKTGNFDHLNGWDTSPVIEKAQKSGSKVYFSVLIANKNNSALLNNPDARKKCVSMMLVLLKKRNANGVNISYKNLAKKDKQHFSEFIKLACETLHAENPAYQLFITIPHTNFDGAYDLEELNKYADRFFVDFASHITRASVPLAPLTGKGHETVDASFTWYAAQGINAEKLIVILPYRGTRCLSDPLSSGNAFTGYLPFSEIQNMTQSRVDYSLANETAYIDTVYHDLHAYRIWFDNEFSLSKKYDYILKNNVGGVGLYYINYDDSFNVLNDELMYKFTEVDTTYLKPVDVTVPKLSLLEKLKRHVVLWNFILQNPCATCFENSVKISGESSNVNTYVKDLQIYKLIKIQKHLATKTKKVNPVKSYDVKVNDVFNYVNQELNTVLKYVSLLFFFIGAGFIILYILGIRNNGADWHYGKLVAGILVVIVSLFVLFAFTYCFTSDLIPIFGVSKLSAGSADCVTDPNCINIPFYTLLLIIFIGILLGAAIFRYLITPLLKRDDLP